MIEASAIAHAGGKNSESAALHAALAKAGVVLQHSGTSPSEALLFGIAGGIGVGYVHSPGQMGWTSGITVAGRHKLYATGPDFLAGALERLGISFDVSETPSEKVAERSLFETLEAGALPIVYAEPCHLPYWNLPIQYIAHGWTHVVVAYGFDAAASEVVVGDLPVGTLTVAVDALASARAMLSAARNRMLRVLSAEHSTITTPRLAAAVRQGIEACAQEMTRPKNPAFSLDALREWSTLLKSDRHPKGWLRLYPGGKLYAALRDVYATTEAMSGGSLHRELYAEFLEEAGAAIKAKKIADMGKPYRKLAHEWSEFADACLPNDCAPFRETKQIWKERYSLFRRKGAEFVPKMKKHADRQLQLDQWLVKDFPLGGKDTEKLLTDLQKRLTSLIDGELSAAMQLSNSLS